jgi:hypothetical protein
MALFGLPVCLFRASPIGAAIENNIGLDVDESAVVAAKGTESQDALDLRASETLAEVYALLARRGHELRCRAERDHLSENVKEKKP